MINIVSLKDKFEMRKEGAECQCHIHQVYAARVA